MRVVEGSLVVGGIGENAKVVVDQQIVDVEELIAGGGVIDCGGGSCVVVTGHCGGTARSPAGGITAYALRTVLVTGADISSGDLLVVGGVRMV